MGEAHLPGLALEAVPGLKPSPVEAQVGHLAHKGVHLDLEDLGQGGTIPEALRGGGEGLQDQFQKGQDPDLPLPGSQGHGVEEAPPHRLVEGLLQGFSRDLLPFQVLLQEALVRLHDGLEDLLAEALHPLPFLRGDLRLPFLPVLVAVGLAVEDVNKPHPLPPFVEGQVYGEDGAQGAPQVLQEGVVVPALVQLGDHHHPGEAEPLRHGPGPFRAHLHPGLRGHGHQGGVRGLQGPPDLPHEVPVARGVQEEDAVAPKEERGHPGAHRGAVELGLGGVVRGGGALLHPAPALLGPGLVK